MELKKTPQKTAEVLPAGFELLHRLHGHTGIFSDISWSPDGRITAHPVIVDFLNKHLRGRRRAVNRYNREENKS